MWILAMGIENSLHVAIDRLQGCDARKLKGAAIVRL
jgi:hypothetical protein